MALDPDHPPYVDHLRRIQPPGSPTLRVVLRSRHRITVLGVLSGEPRHVRTLDPFVSRLLVEGIGGTLDLVDAATGGLVARRLLEPPTRPRSPGLGTNPVDPQTP